MKKTILHFASSLTLILFMFTSCDSGDYGKNNRDTVDPANTPAEHRNPPSASDPVPVADSPSSLTDTIPPGRVMP